MGRGPRPNAGDNLADTAPYDRRAGVHDDGALAFSAGAHDYAAFVASDRRAAPGETGPGHWGAQPGTVCTATDSHGDAEPECDDGPFGKGTGGQLRYEVTVRPAARETRLDRGRRRPARTSQRRAARPRPPAGREGRARARGWASSPRSTCPATASLQEAVDWGKQNLADLTQTRDRPPTSASTDEGKAVPAADRARSRSVTLDRRRLPGLPVALRHRRRVHGVRRGRARAVRGDQGAPASRCVTSRTSLNDRSGKVAHEIVTDGSVYYGANSRRRQHRRDGRSSRAPSRCSGAGRATTASATRCTTSRCATCGTSCAHARRRRGRLARGPGQRRAHRAWGRRSSTTPSTSSAASTTWPTWRAAKRDGATERWAKRASRDKLRARFDPHVVGRGRNRSTPTRSTDAERSDPAEALDRRHADGGRADASTARRCRAWRRSRHGDAALAERETPCYSGARRRSTRACSTPAAAAARPARASGSIYCARRPRSRRSARATTGASAGPAAALHDANAEPMFAEPARVAARRAAGRACRRSCRSPDQDANIDRCWTCRSMFMQAWGHYGTAWPVDPPAARRPAVARHAGGSTSCRRCPTGQPRDRGARTSGSATATVDVRAERGADDRRR